MPCRVGMALDPKQLSKLLQLRALGWSQQEIAAAIGVSRQVIGYQLKKLKKESEIKGTEEVFRSALIGGLAGAAAGIGLFALLNELFME